ncbi:MAG: hypothetical protein GX600_11525, partial [Dehalococcoidia bacterium]|nr:hypothetical protein [Dehalococcoidia bacterium]
MSSGRRVMVAVNGFVFQRDGAFVADGGFLFWLENTKLSMEMLEHEDNPYIASLDYHGDKAMMGKTLVGLAFPKDWDFLDIDAWIDGDLALPVCVGVQVLRSETTDVCCPRWDSACKPPSGQAFATVKFTPDGKMAYAVTQGESRRFEGEGFDGAQGWGRWADESAFSISGHEDVLGNAWNQSGLIDTDIDYIADVAVASASSSAAACASACSCIYMGTINHWTGYWEEVIGGEPIWHPDAEAKVGSCDSIWRSCDGKTWLRIWHKALEGMPMEPYWM